MPQNKFKKAVENTPDVKNGYQAGLRALGNYSSKVRPPSDSHRVDGSVDIDGCTQTKYPSDNRWDYAVSCDSQVYFVEIHPGNTSDVDVVLRKFQWLKQWLEEHAPEINKLKSEYPYYWLPVKGNHIDKRSPQSRKIHQAGVIISRVLQFPQ